MSEEKHVWVVGDLCLCTYNNNGTGVIYRVIKLLPGNWGSLEGMLEIAPAHGVIAKTSNRGKRKIGSGYCTYVSLLELGAEYLKFGLFIQEEARRKGMNDAAARPSNDE